LDCNHHNPCIILVKIFTIELISDPTKLLLFKYLLDCSSYMKEGTSYCFES
jgi:hypothetical protein